jgi:hypothetical protein
MSHLLTWPRAAPWANAVSVLSSRSFLQPLSTKVHQDSLRQEGEHRDEGVTFTMVERRTLETYLKSWDQGVAARRDVATTVIALASACIAISKLLARGALAGPLGALTGKRCELDPQREIDVRAHDAIVASLAHAPVALLISEERDEPLSLASSAPLVVAVDPMDGATNADTNAAIGTIFSILPNATIPAYLAIGRAQLASGFVIYGPQTLLVLTVGSGTVVFTLNPERYLRALGVEPRDPQRRDRIRDQRLEPLALGRTDPHLRRRLPSWPRRPSPHRLQHALDRVVRCRTLPNTRARRRLPLSRRPPEGVPQRPPPPDV